MEENAMYDIGHEVEDLDARSAAAIEALQHESANLREAAEMRAKTALDLKATSDAQVKVASTVNLINRSMSGAFRALAALRAKIMAYKQDTAQAADELLAEAAEIEASLKANQEETFEAVTQVLGAALSEIAGDAPVMGGAAEQQGRGGEPRETRTEEVPAEQKEATGRESEENNRDEPPAPGLDPAEAHARAEDIDRRTPAFNDLDEPDGVAAPGAVPSRRLEEDRLDALFAFMKENFEAINGRMSEIERVVNQPGESEQGHEADKAVREQGDAEEDVPDSNDSARTDGREEDGGEQAEGQDEAVDEAGPDLHEGDTTGENPSHPDVASSATRAANDAATPRREEDDRPEPATHAAPTAVPSRLTRTSGFGDDARTRPERVKEVYSSAQAIMAEQEEDGPAPAGEPPMERRHENSLVEALKDKRGYL